MNFGSEVLTNPLLVESIENDFVPLLVRNNHAGREAELLKRYKERSWNNPVVRFVGSDGKDLISRKGGIYSLQQLLPRMNAALVAKKKQSVILPLLEAEVTPRKQIAFSQHCFWTGELKLGGISGVLATEAGWLNGKEVTLVSYNPREISEKSLTKQAKALSCANQVFSGSSLSDYRPARQSDQKRQLQGTAFAKIPNLNRYQRTKLNAFARTDPQKAKSFLSPAQLAELTRR